MTTEGPAILAVEDAGGITRLIAAIAEQTIEAVIEWNCANYPPVNLGVFTTPTCTN